jgi:AcrR family transcriptional regulator
VELNRSSATAETRDRVLDAAVATILDVGYYRASTNEIARRAGVSWGVLQYHFGTRERLMLAVLEHGQRRLAAIVDAGIVAAPTLEDRLEQLLDILAEYYGAPEYLAYLQVTLDLGLAPDTTDEVRSIAKQMSTQTIDAVVRLTRATLGPAYSSELTSTIFLALRGFAISELLAHVSAHDALPTTEPAERRRRRMLARALAPYFEAIVDEVRADHRPPPPSSEPKPTSP